MTHAAEFALECGQILLYIYILTTVLHPHPQGHPHKAQDTHGQKKSTTTTNTIKTDERNHDHVGFFLICRRLRTYGGPPPPAIIAVTYTCDDSIPSRQQRQCHLEAHATGSSLLKTDDDNDDALTGAPE